MMKCVAFLRAINVGGKNKIKMADLVLIFESLGLKNVKTYIQSGNVIFETTESDPGIVRNSIEQAVENVMGKKIAVIIRTKEEIQAVIQRDPFANNEWGENPKLYVCFLDRKPLVSRTLPLRIEKEALVLISIVKNDAFLVSLPKEDEHFGFPNPYIEKEFKLLSTARNWNTVVKIAEMMD